MSRLQPRIPTASALGVCQGVESEQDKAHINRLKRLKQIGVDLDWLKHLTEQMKKGIAYIEQATDEIENIDGGKGDLTNAPQI